MTTAPVEDRPAPDFDPLEPDDTDGGGLVDGDGSITLAMPLKL